MPDIAPLSVFISSPCYDLVDLRYELKAHLEQQGCLVRLSEDPSSAFYVDPLEDSIDTCLANVEQSDVVICVLDREYGPPLPKGYGGKSATHLEVERARERRIPVFFFVRDEAWLEFGQLKRDSAIDVPWVEKYHPDRRKLWVNFVKECSQLDAAKNQSNWRDQFRSSVDLKQLVDYRLLAAFPRRSVAKALSPDRLVRLNFVLAGQPVREKVFGHFRNSTTNTAFELKHGWRLDLEEPVVVGLRGALGEKESVTVDGSHDPAYDIPIAFDKRYRAVFCVYENTFGDRYRVELPFQVDREDLELVLPVAARGSSRATTGTRAQSATLPVLRPKRERFFVLGGTTSDPKWIEINAEDEVSVPPPEPF